MTVGVWIGMGIPPETGPHDNGMSRKYSSQQSLKLNFEIFRDRPRFSFKLQQLHRTVALDFYLPIIISIRTPVYGLLLNCKHSVFLVRKRL